MSEDNKNLLSEGTVRRFMTLANLKSITPLETLREQPELPFGEDEGEAEAAALEDDAVVDDAEAGLALDLGDDDAAADLELDALGDEEGAEEDEAAGALAQEIMDEIKPVLTSFLAQNADIAIDDTAAMTPPAPEVELDVDIEAADEEGPAPAVEVEDDEEVVELAEGAINEEDDREKEEDHYRENEWSDEDRLDAIIDHARALKRDEHEDKVRADDLGESKLVETVAARVAERILKLNGDDRS